MKMLEVDGKIVMNIDLFSEDQLTKAFDLLEQSRVYKAFSPNGTIVEGGETYLVVEMPNGDHQCECKASEYARLCYHIAAVILYNFIQLEQEQSNAA